KKSSPKNPRLGFLQSPASRRAEVSIPGGWYRSCWNPVGIRGNTSLRFLVMSVLEVMLLAVPPLSAQIVADGATKTLSNVTNTITGDVIVGTNGSFTLLVLSNNCLLTNSVSGFIGFNATAKSNEVRLV